MPVPKVPVFERVDCTTVSSKRLSIRTNNTCFLAALKFAFEFESDFDLDFELKFESVNFQFRSECRDQKMLWAINFDGASVQQRKSKRF